MSVNKEAWVEKAATYLLGGFNCAQAVLLTMQEYWGIDSPVKPAVASGFAGGIGSQGSVCGAMVGGVMAIGLKYGTSESSVQKRAEASHMVAEFFNRFKEELGNVYCRDLVGFDLSTAEGREKAWASNVFREKCPGFVKCAVRILMDL